jgi:hypothetical protein
VRRNNSQLPSSGFFSRSAVTGVYFCRISGIGPGTGVAEVGAIVCCADAPTIPLAARMAAAHAPCMRTLALVMAFLPVFVVPLRERRGPCPNS